MDEKFDIENAVYQKLLGQRFCQPSYENGEAAVVVSDLLEGGLLLLPLFQYFNGTHSAMELVLKIEESARKISPQGFKGNPE